MTNKMVWTLGEDKSIVEGIDAQMLAQSGNDVVPMTHDKQVDALLFVIDSKEDVEASWDNKGGVATIRREGGMVKGAIYSTHGYCLATFEQTEASAIEWACNMLDAGE